MKYLPIHPLTGLTAIGWRKARRGETGEQPIWPILGGSEEADDGAEGEENAEGGEESEGEGAVEGEDALGDAGKRALDKMKADLRAEKARRKAAETELAGLKTKPAAGEAPDAEAIRAQALAEARAEALNERALDRLEAKAARLFADPEDARLHLAGKVADFVDGDKVDNDAINDALTDLLARKPHLGIAGTKPRFEGTGDGGARKGSSGVQQLGQADLKRMTAEQIVAAQKAGQFDEFLATEST